ncbi:MAG TPA: TonB-dependent receptor [Steroidobacteraceae bacterium]|nr:TonB-dependent receptor [Steroidobacteraceae bacterium]
MSNPSRPSFHRLGVGVVVGLSLQMPAVLAQSPSARTPEPLGEITVTATLREESLIDVPASISVLDRQTLADAGEQHFQDVIGLVPNLNWAAGSSRPRYFQLRGVGDLEQYQGAPNPSIGFLVDDIDFSGVGMVATLFDVDQIEVLRGPQGTRYGANALGGLIKVKTREPERDFDATTEASVGQDDEWSIGAVIGGPIGGTETGAFRVGVQQYESDGFRRNAFLGRDDTNGRDELTARARLRFEPTERWQVDVSVLALDLDNGYDAFSIDNSRVTESDHPGSDSQRSIGGSVDLRYHADAFDVVSITAYADSDIDYGFDGDWGNNAFWGVPYDFTTSIVRNRHTFTQDLRLESPPAGADRPLAWIAGAYVRRLDESNDQLDQGVYLTDVTFNPLESDYWSTNYALYGELDWALTPAFGLTLGLRAEGRDAQYEDSSGERFTPTDDMLGGSLTTSYAFSDQLRWYASLSRGFKSGGFNIGAAITPDRRQYGPEYLWNLETGVKALLADRRLETDVTLFYMQRRNEQVETSFQFDPTDPLTFVFYTDNAAQGRNYGLEASVRWLATDTLSLDASLGLLRSYYVDYMFGDRNLDGREQTNAPSYSYSVGLTWRHPFGWMARLGVNGRDAYYYSASNDQRARVATLVNAKAGYESERWSVYLWGQNVFDEDYSQLGFFFGNEPPDFPDKRYTQAGDPRQLGLTAQWRFR